MEILHPKDFSRALSVLFILQKNEEVRKIVPIKRNIFLNMLAMKNVVFVFLGDGSCKAGQEFYREDMLRC